ncbi:MAG: SGNH/GDSL hydrolase family protein [Terrimicrobiaceae bacterium]
MKTKTMICAFGLLNVLLVPPSSAESSESQPTWELGKNPIDAVTTKGQVDLVDGVIKLDGTNSFAVPAGVLGEQSDYTIEFEVKKPADAKGAISLMSNTGEKSGLGLKYCPPDYNAGLLFINGIQTVEQRGFLGDKFSKITLVAKDKRVTLFRDGLILAMANEVNPSQLPITFGEILKAPTAPYELRNIKIFARALFPTGFDASADRMRYCSGPGFAMQRVEVKDPTLPRILVVGDSISMGYRGFITEHFKGRAYVDYWSGGGWFEFDIKGDDFPALRAWDGVLANGPYDVVTWNASTLHMWNGSPGRCSEEKFPANMTKAVEHIQKAAPDTKLIWIRCTPWRTTPESGRAAFDPVRNDVIIRLNDVTDRIMKAHGIPIVDLYSLAAARMDTVPEGSKDSVHWNKEVSAEMAGEIIKEIEKVLTAKHAAKEVSIRISSEPSRCWRRIWLGCQTRSRM